MRPIDADALKAKFCNHCDERDCKPDATDTVYGCVIADTIDNMPTIEAITREQFAEAAKQLMNEFTANDGYGTSASATFLALCFGNLELRLFKYEDGGSE